MKTDLNYLNSDITKVPILKLQTTPEDQKKTLVRLWNMVLPKRCCI